MKNVLTVVIGLGLTSFALGCAGTTFREASDANANGIRYYPPTTYILVKPDYESGRADVTFWTGPDTTVPYAIDPYAFASKNTTEFSFENGILTTLSSHIDTTKVASDVISGASEVIRKAMEVAAKAAIAAREDTDTQKVEPDIYLFMATKDGFIELYPGRRTITKSQ